MVKLGDNCFSLVKERERESWGIKEKMGWDML